MVSYKTLFPCVGGERNPDFCKFKMVIFVKAGGLSGYHTSHCVDLFDDDMLCGREGGGCHLPQSTPFFSLVDSELLTTLVA